MKPSACASRAVTGLWPTSTIFARPRESRCESRLRFFIWSQYPEERATKGSDRAGDDPPGDSPRRMLTRDIAAAMRTLLSDLADHPSTTRTRDKVWFIRIVRFRFVGKFALVDFFIFCHE